MNHKYQECGRAREGPLTPDQCGVCWLIINSPRHRMLWGFEAVDLEKLKALPWRPCCGGATGEPGELGELGESNKSPEP
jgi:hypothetical protein